MSRPEQPPQGHLEIPLHEIGEANPVSAPPKIEIGPDGLPISLIHPDDVAAQEEQQEQIESVQTEEEEESSSQGPQPTVSTPSIVLTLLNSLLGAGILSVPNSFTNVGIFPSLIILILMAGLSYVATIMVIILRKKTHATGFPDIAYRVLGKPGSISLSIMSLLFLISCQLAYLVLGGDMLTSWFALAGIDMTVMWKRAIMIFIYAMCLPVLLTIPRKITFLRYFSAATVGFIAFFDISMAVKGIMKFRKDGISKTISYGSIGINMFSALSIYGLTFALPVVCLPVLSMYDKSVSKRSFASGIAMTICVFLAVIPGLFGYLQFGTDTKTNIVQNYEDHDILMIIVRAAFFLVVSFAYPAVGQSTLASWAQICFKTSLANSLVWWKRLIVLLLSNGIPLIVAMFLANAKPALNIGGAMGGCMADFFYPAIMWIKVSDDPIYHWKNILCIIFAAFGLISAVISTYQAIVDAIAAFS